MDRDFQSYGELLDSVTWFKYIVKLLTVGCNYWPVVAGNLSKSRKNWICITRILRRDG